MANKSRGEVPLTVEGREYTLRLSINALCELETELERRNLDSNYMTFFEKAKQGSVAAARLLLWACLRDHDPDVTVTDCGDLIEKIGDLKDLWDVLAQAMGVSKPDEADVAALKGKDAEDARPQTAQGAGTGTRSRRRRVAAA